jgi:hypothetical protein
MMLQGKGATTWVGDSMLRRVHSMLQVVFRQSALFKRAQGHISTPVAEKGLLAYETYAAVYKKCQALSKRQAGAILPQELDPQDNTLSATFSTDELVQMADAMMSSSNKTDARDLSMILAMAHTAGRGDDVRERRLCELTPPIQRTCIGEQPLLNV